MVFDIDAALGCDGGRMETDPDEFGRQTWTWARYHVSGARTEHYDAPILIDYFEVRNGCLEPRNVMILVALHERVPKAQLAVSDHCLGTCQCSDGAFMSAP